jgi:DNA anti-recombination protein RmuC
LKQEEKGIEAKLREKDRELHDMKEKYESEIESIREETNQRFRDHGHDTTKSSIITSKA